MDGGTDEKAGVCEWILKFDEVQPSGQWRAVQICIRKGAVSNTHSADMCVVGQQKT